MLLSERSHNKAQTTAVVMVALKLWFTVVLILGVHGGAYVRAPGAYPLPVIIGVGLPIGASAVWVAHALNRRWEWVAHRSFLLWNSLGILDLAIAVGMVALASRLVLGVYGEITMLPMTQMPLVLVPGFLVPLFVIMHLPALLQARRPAVSNLR